MKQEGSYKASNLEQPNANELHTGLKHHFDGAQRGHHTQKKAGDKAVCDKQQSNHIAKPAIESLYIA